MRLLLYKPAIFVNGVIGNTADNLSEVEVRVLKISVFDYSCKQFTHLGVGYRLKKVGSHFLFNN